MESLTLTLGDLIVIITVLLSFAGCLCSFWLLRDKDLKRIDEKIAEKTSESDCEIRRDNERERAKILHSTLVGNISDLKVNVSEFKGHMYGKLDEIIDKQNALSTELMERMLKESNSKF